MALLINASGLQDGEDSEGEVDGPAITSTKAAAFAALAGSEDAEVDDDDESSPAIAESHSAHAEHAEQVLTIRPPFLAACRPAPLLCCSCLKHLDHLQACFCA